MRQLLKSAVTIFALPVICVGIFIVAKPASGDEGLTGSYIGISGATNGNNFGSFLDGRINIGKSPVSVRVSTTGDCGGEVCVLGFIPTITYDLAVSNNANVYLGGGAAIATASAGGLTASASEFVLIGGAETGLSKRAVLYGDVTYGPNSGDAIWKVGVGYRF